MSLGFGYINDLVHKVGVWSNKTFDRATPSSILAHLKLEVQELSDNPTDVEEAADCVLLLFHLAHKQGWNLEQAIFNKFYKNQNRRWGEPNPDGVVEHIE